MSSRTPPPRRSGRRRSDPDALRRPVRGARLVSRPRLLDTLAARFEHRVVAIVAGPGFGKTTALTQALNAGGRDIDHWLGCEPGDARASQLAEGLLRAIGLGADGMPAPSVETEDDMRAVVETIAGAVWSEQPRQVALVLDDVHEIPDDSLSATLLQTLLDALPENGHLVVASRRKLPLRLGRLRTHGQVLELDVDDLRFAPAELVAFAELRGTDPDRLDPTGGWPALAEITATATATAATTGRATGEFVWEEVLGHLEPERRKVLAVFADLGRIDEPLAAAALGRTVSLPAFGDVPLVTLADGGSLIVHPLWRGHLGRELDAEEWLVARRGAAHELVGRGLPDAAVDLLERSRAWPDVLEVFRRVGASPHPAPPPDVLADWLERMPIEYREEPEALLLAGIRTRATDVPRAVPIIENALTRFREHDDADGQCACLAQLGLISYWTRDFERGAAVLDAILDLERRGVPEALPLACVGRAVFASASGDSDGVLTALAPLSESLEPLSAELTTAAAWLRASAAFDSGRFEESVRIVEQAQARANRGFWPVLEYVRLVGLFAIGELDAAIAGWPAQLDAALRSGVRRHLWYSQLAALEQFAKVGRVEDARRIATTLRTVLGGPDPEMRAAAYLVDLWLAVADSAEVGVREALRALAALPPGLVEWDNAASVVYLLPASERPAFTTTIGLGGVALSYALALGAGRDGDPDPLGDLQLPSTSRAIAMLGHSGAAELAQLAAAAGRAGGTTFVTAVGAISAELAVS